MDYLQLLSNCRIGLLLETILCHFTSLLRCKEFIQHLLIITWSPFCILFLGLLRIWTRRLCRDFSPPLVRCGGVVLVVEYI